MKKEIVKKALQTPVKQIAENGIGPENQIPSAGCSIKWKQ